MDLKKMMVASGLILGLFSTMTANSQQSTKKKMNISDVETPLSPCVTPQFQYTNEGIQVCADAGRATFTSMVSAGIVTWYTTATGGTPISTGTNFTTPIVSENTTFYAEINDNGCLSDYRKPFTVQVHKLTISPYPSVTIGIGESVQLVGSSYAGDQDYLWDPATGLNNVNTSSPIASPTTTTTYSVLVQADAPYGCEWTKQVTVIVENCTTPQFTYTSSGMPICGDQGKAMLTAYTTGGIVKWYTSATGGTSIGTGANFQTPLISENTTYYAEIENGACRSQRKAFEVHVLKLTVSPSPTIYINPGQSVQLHASSYAPDYANNWTPATGLNNSHTANPIATPSTTTTYTVTTNAGAPYGCIWSKTVTVQVNPCNAGEFMTSSAGNPICADNGTATLSATTNAGTISWFTSPTGGMPIGTGTSFTTPLLSTTTTFYAEINNAGCISPVRKAFEVPVLTLTVTPALSYIFPGESVTLNASTSVPAFSFVWSPAFFLSNSYSANPVASPPFSTNYTVTAYSGAPYGCVWTKSAFVKVRRRNPIVTLFPNPTSENIVVEFAAEQEKKQKYEIRNEMGVLVKTGELATQTGTNQHKISVSDLKPGRYLIVLDTDQKELNPISFQVTE